MWQNIAFFPLKQDVCSEGVSRALGVWIAKPNVVIKFVNGAEKCFESVYDFNPTLTDGLVEFMSKFDNSTTDDKDTLWKLVQDTIELRTSGASTSTGVNSKKLYVLFREMFVKPKSNPEKTNRFDIVVHDKVDDVSVTIMPFKKITEIYSIRFNKKQKRLYFWVYDVNSRTKEEILDTPWVRTLLDKLMPKLVKWASQEAEKVRLGVETNLSKNSTFLISTLDYCALYDQLKAKYLEYLLKNWTEKTDPNKYIFEDIGIATYLLLLWRRFGDSGTADCVTPVSYVDVGCGNGLLVHILNSEGHKGVGVDLRKRRMWDMLKETADLREATLLPSGVNDDQLNLCEDTTIFGPHCQWLIGNHSDELTPWIPVMATRCSYKTKFIVIPCCAFDFFCKYNRINSRISQYQEYIDFIGEEVCQRQCRFETFQDKLRIPSTKRICLVGNSREYPEAEYEWVKDQLSKFIRGRRRPGDNRGEVVCLENNKMVLPKDPEFVPRDKKERIRNCTQVNADVLNTLAGAVIELLIREAPINAIYVPLRDLAHPLHWRTGGTLTIGALASAMKEVPKWFENFKFIRKECGGLQTLIKNKPHLFNFYKGAVRLTDPRLQKPVWELHPDSQRKNRTRPCLHFLYHPDGCPFGPENCRFAHEQPIRPVNRPVENKGTKRRADEFWNDDITEGVNIEYSAEWAEQEPECHDEEQYYEDEEYY